MQGLKKASLNLPEGVRQDIAEAALMFVLTFKREVCQTEAWQEGQSIPQGTGPLCTKG